ncbi:MAG: hypothetical protein M3083_25710 [Actinomycetota bacterium]|nr:hypothetical protein [Actinomycetota bacterium]
MGAATFDSATVLYATVGTQSKVPLLDLDGTKVKVSMQSGNFVLDGTVAKSTRPRPPPWTTHSSPPPSRPACRWAPSTWSPKGSVTSPTDKVSEVGRLTGRSTSVALDAGTAKAPAGLGVVRCPERVRHL